jgi:hypothetical protein
MRAHVLCKNCDTALESNPYPGSGALYVTTRFSQRSVQTNEQWGEAQMVLDSGNGWWTEGCDVTQSEFLDEEVVDGPDMKCPECDHAINGVEELLLLLIEGEWEEEPSVFWSLIGYPIEGSGEYSDEDEDGLDSYWEICRSVQTFLNAIDRHMLPSREGQPVKATIEALLGLVEQQLKEEIEWSEPVALEPEPISLAGRDLFAELGLR